MKKIIIASLLFGALTAFAMTDIPGCMDSKSISYNPLATISDGSCKYPTNGDPMKVVQPWGLDGYHTPIIKGGVKDCPLWYKWGCFDLAGIDNYAQKMVDWYYSFGGHQR